jgi:hypothetical protein
MRTGIKMTRSVMTRMAYPPPPLPSSPKGSRKALIAVVAVVAVVAVAVGVYLATRGGGGGGTTTGVAEASSLRFSVDLTPLYSVHTKTYKFMIKNIGASNMMMHIEVTSTEGNFVYIVNGAQQKAWEYANGEWTDLSNSFSAQWNSWNSTWTDYRDYLLGKGGIGVWPGSGDWTYTAEDNSAVRIYNITVNPSLADSLFQYG